MLSIAPLDADSEPRFNSLGLADDGDVETFNRRRAVELKHGRVAMLAVTGYIIQGVSRFPGSIDLDGTSFDSIPNGIGAIGAVPFLGWLQIIGSVGYWELVGWADKEIQEDSDLIGNFGFYPGSAPEGDKLVEQRTKELQNGRLAMLAIMELLTNAAEFIQQLKDYDNKRASAVADQMAAQMAV